jgi:hypothetical protein
VAAGTAGVNARGQDRARRGVPVTEFRDAVAAEVASRSMATAS